MNVIEALKTASDEEADALYEVICGTCNYRFGDHFGPDDNMDCPIENTYDPMGSPMRNPNEDERTYWSDQPERFAGASRADIEALAELGVMVAVAP